jgi:hypothetical protein
MKPSQVASALQICINAHRPVIIWGAPGVGKSQLGLQVSTLLSRRYIDIRASLLDAVDLRGIPNIVNGKTFWATPAFLPSDNTPTLINLDELNRAPVMTMNGLLQLVLDRQLGEYRLPDATELIACCNRESDGGGVQKMPQALSNRFVHLEMEPDVDDWCRWAVRSNIEPAVIAFIRWRPELLHKFSRTDRAFPTPRSWEFVSQITAQKPGKDLEESLYSGAVGGDASTEYISFLRLFRNLPNIDAILLNPASAPVPSEPSTLFAISSALARRASVTNFGRVLTYMDRLPQEYGVYCVQDAVRRDGALASTPEFTRWSVNNAAVAF